MSIAASLTYQKKFFNDFTDAWHKKSRYRLYQGLDATAENLRLDIEETPGYILAYDKNAQAELHDFLQIGLIDFLRQHIPFFEVNDQGTVYFGNWYHRREFGHINVILRAITQSADEQRRILPQLEAFSDDPDHYLDRQLDAMRKEVYRDVDSLHTQIDNLEAENAPERGQASQGNSGFRGLLKNFIDPSDDDQASPSQPSGDASRLKAQFDKEKLTADDIFDKRKRELEVSAAITRYEFQAVMGTYSSVAEFENILANLKDDFMQSLKLEGGRTHA